MSLIISILLGIIILGVVFWAARALIGAFKIPEPIATVIMVVLVLLALLLIINWIGVDGFPSRLNR